MTLTNKEKTTRRIVTLDQFAQAYASVNPEFMDFSHGKPTMRRFETWIKRKYENHETIRVVLKPSQILDITG